MQVRYVFDPGLQHPRSRLALALIPPLADQIGLKAEPVGGKVSEAWKSLYAHLSQPALAARVQLYHGPLAGFKAHPLQWNVFVDSQEGPPPADADEIWVFSSERAEELCEAGTARDKIHVLPPAVGTWTVEAGELPMELKEPKVLFCSLGWEQRRRLDPVLRAYVPAFAGQGEVSLALHLDAPATESGVEEELMSLLEAAAAETGAELDKLNLETWIGPLEPAGYLALLEKCQVLLSPSETLQALEALSLGKQVLGLADQALGTSAELSPESLRQALEKPRQPFSGSLDALVEALVTEFRRIEGAFDHEARALAWHQAQEHARQGRKQKYSLFHSDYQEPEMQARRQWHLRYARFFDGQAGDLLDIGCGSGIFLEIMRDLGMPACGVDPDPDMVDVCRELGLQALPGDERLLAQWQPESLGGIHASHVIEHIDGARAIALIENAFRVLRPGGQFLVRTPNWRNETVRHEGFWLDITHIRPYPLPLLKQVFEDAGFTVEQMGFEEFGWNDTFILGRKPGGLTHG